MLNRFHLILAIIIFICALLVICLCNDANAEWKPTGYNSRSDGLKRSLLSGAEPQWYDSSGQWVDIVTDWIDHDNGYKMVRSRHNVSYDTNTHIIRFWIEDDSSGVHILRTKPDALFFYDKSDGDTIRIANPSFDNVSVLDNTILFTNLYPKVDLRIISKPSGFNMRYHFKRASDSTLDYIWLNTFGADSNILVVNATRVWKDSLDCTWEDDSGSVNPDNSGELHGKLNWKAELKRLFGFRQARIWSSVNDTLTAKLYHRLQHYGNKLLFMTGYKLAGVDGWPDGGYEHPDDASWATSAVDTWIYFYSQTTTYYAGEAIRVERDALALRRWGMIYFADLIDSISGASSIDSALLKLHYISDATADSSTQICRGIDDEEWYEDTDASWDFLIHGSSTAWTGGEGNQEGTVYTLTNAVTKALADTTDYFWVEFPITDIITDIKTAGTDYGLWLNSPGGDQTYMVWDSSDDTGGNFPTLYVEYTTDGAPPTNYRRRRILVGGK